MATVRLFAGLREAAGSSRADLPGATVGEVLEAAVARFGPRFAAGLPRARVWVNGEEAGPASPVGPGDEVALIPPVSGGALDMPGPVATRFALPLGLLALLVVTNVLGRESWWAAAVVALTTVWALDVVATLADKARDVPVVPTLVTVGAVVVAARLLGGPGLGIGLAVAVIATLGWGVASDTSRLLTILAPAFVIALLAGTATGSLLLAGFEWGPRVVGVYLAAVVVGSGLSLASRRFPQLPGADPFTASVVGAVVGALVSAAVWGLDLVAYLIVGLVVGASLVAGSALGSLLRSRSVILLDVAPGLAAVLDGPVLAACAFFPIVALVG